MRSAILAAALLLAAATTAHAADLTVGPGKAFSRIEDAMAAAQPGDVILVHPLPDGKAYERAAIYVTKPRLTFRGMAPKGERVKIDGKGFAYSGSGSTPRAIFQFNKGADGGVLEGFELTGAHNASHNGAGVRINQASDVTVRGCRVHGNDMGIMSNGDGTTATAANQLFEGCLIEANGCLEDPGYNHNLYLGGTSVTLRACEVRGSLTGHNVKSRARQTTVLWSYIHDSANREFDLVDAKGDTTAPGSNAILFGNVIAKDRACRGNRGVIHFGQDGKSEHDGTIWIVNNTIVTPFASPVVSLSAPKARAVLTNNIIWDGGTPQSNQRLIEAKAGAKDVSRGSCNWLAAGFAADAAALAWPKTFIAPPRQSPPFADAAKGDFRLAKSDPAIVDAGDPLDEAILPLLGGKPRQYLAPLGTEERPAAGKPDLGAYEFADGAPALSAP